MLVGLLVGFPLGGGHVAALVREVRKLFFFLRVKHGAPAVLPGFEGGGGGDWVSGPGGGVKRVRLNRKTPGTPRKTWYFWGFSLGHA